MASWDGIDEFLAVATAGTFIGGARALRVSPSHMSRAIMALEARMNVQLFDRTTRTVRLTDTGRVFLEQCSRLVQERDEAIASLSDGGAPAGELRVTCPTAMGERFIAPILRRLAVEHPGLSISVDLSNHIVDIVAEGYDLAIRTGALSDSRLIRTKVGARRLLTCATPAYLDGAPPLAAVEHLDAHDCVIGTAAAWPFREGERKILYRPKGRFRCNSGHAVLEAALAGMGVCQLPEFYLLPHLRSGRLRSVLDAFAPEEEPVWAVHPQRRQLVPKVRVAIDAIRRHLMAEMAPPAHA